MASLTATASSTLLHPDVLSFNAQHAIIELEFSVGAILASLPMKGIDYEHEMVIQDLPFIENFFFSFYNKANLFLNVYSLTWMMELWFYTRRAPHLGYYVICCPL